MTAFVCIERLFSGFKKVSSLKNCKEKKFLINFASISKKSFSDGLLLRLFGKCNLGFQDSIKMPIVADYVVN